MSVSPCNTFTINADIGLGSFCCCNMSNNTDERYVAMARDVIHVRFELLKIFEMFNNAFTMRLLIPISSQKDRDTDVESMGLL